jgi:hypothetical protein
VSENCAQLLGVIILFAVFQAQASEHGDMANFTPRQSHRSSLPIVSRRRKVVPPDFWSGQGAEPEAAGPIGPPADRDRHMALMARMPRGRPTQVGNQTTHTSVAKVRAQGRFRVRP